MILTRNSIPFLVIEPAKGEYKREFAKLPNINIFTTNPKYYNMLSINPFEFQNDIHVLEHLDRLIEIFSACWPLYAAMPALLKSSFEKAYIRHGWDLNHSIHIDKGNGKYPNFNDIVDILPGLLEKSDFSAQTKGDYIGSLVTRVQSLTNGLVGQIFNSYSIPDETLFDSNSIVDLSRIGSAETKALIMGSLILKLNEYRQASSVGVNNPLKHITILEEAHNLLKRTSTQQGQELSNVQGKSVEMISNSIAEMRTYGEGFIIVDQSPTAVDISAIKNTNTKIIMRLPEKNDREDVGTSVGLDSNQINELSRLSQGVGIIYQNDWIEAVQVKIDSYESKYKSDTPKINDDRERLKLVGDLLNELIMQDLRKYYVVSRLIKIVSSSGVNSMLKNRYNTLLYDYNRLFRTPQKQKAFSKLIFNLLECEPLFKMFEESIPSKKCMDIIPQALLDETKKWCDSLYKELDNYAVFPSTSIKDISFMATILYKYNTESSRDQKYKFLVQSVYTMNK